jgi:2-keto-4-pentenoate hydratase/2-oxohepta-3-ene-1,7-dioic acid hydratase in catechol pathway
MKLVLFKGSASDAGYGVLTPRGVISLEDVIATDEPQAMLEELATRLDELRPRLDALAASGTAIPLDSAPLLPPVPRPGKILISTATYGERIESPPPLLMTLKSAESVIGPGDTVRLPDVDSSWQFVPQTMLGLVVRGPAKGVKADAWHTAVFGYTCAIDIMARGDQLFGRDYWLAKADTLGPLGPCIVTVDELPDPSVLHVRSWQNGSPAQDFRIADASHPITEQVEFATTVMTLHTGDVLACGSSLVGPQPVGDGDQVEVEIDGVGRLAVRVAAPVGSAG